MSDQGRIKLHISPFSASLLDAVIPKTIQPVASGISYHVTQTDPDKGFGYVELPKAEADKLRKKLNGLVLRGSKMNIEVAKPEKKRRHELADGPEVPERKSKKAKKDKTPKADLTGYELPDGRSVKRGWTATDKEHKADKKQKREKSKYTSRDEKEMLFKLGKKNKTSTKASKPAKDGDKKKPTKDPNIVHEFERNTKTPSFLRNEKAGRSGADLTFVDGQGWVDEYGNVVEPVKARSKAVPIERIVESVTAPEAPKAEKKGKKKVPEPETPVEDSDDSASGEDSLESEDESNDDSSESQESEAASEIVVEGKAEDEGSTDATVPNAERPVDHIAKEPIPTHETMDVDVPAEPKAVHPLEALYKRRAEDAPKLAPLNTSFSFFDVEGNDQDDIVADDAMPQTPFTKQDRQVRGLRSAAPTPDTAAIGRKFSFAFGEAADEDNEEDDDDRRPSDSPLDVKGDGATSALSAADAEPKEQSTFVKEFYERRADMNRSWKQRRREALKQQRQRENRRLSRKPL